MKNHILSQSKKRKEAKKRLAFALKEADKLFKKLKSLGFGTNSLDRYKR